MAGVAHAMYQSQFFGSTYGFSLYEAVNYQPHCDIGSCLCPELLLLVPRQLHMVVIRYMHQVSPLQQVSFSVSLHLVHEQLIE